MAKWKQVQKYSNHILSPLENLAKNLSLSSMILILDATPVSIAGRKHFILIAYDAKIGVIDYELNKAETKKVYADILNRLKRIGYVPICVVSDGNIGLKLLLREKKYPQQRCVVHLLRDLERLLGKKKGRKLKGKNLSIYKKIRKIWYIKELEKVPHKIGNSFGERWIFEWVWETLPNAILHLSYKEKIPNSTNILENLNGQIKQRIKTMRGIKSKESLRNWLKIFFYFRNYK